VICSLKVTGHQRLSRHGPQGRTRVAVGRWPTDWMPTENTAPRQGRMKVASGTSARKRRGTGPVDAGDVKMACTKTETFGRPCRDAKCWGASSSGGPLRRPAATFIGPCRARKLRTPARTARYLRLRAPREAPARRGRAVFQRLFGRSGSNREIRVPFASGPAGSHGYVRRALRARLQRAVPPRCSSALTVDPPFASPIPSLKRASECEFSGQQEFFGNSCFVE
jgi:hypothetical protein